MVERESRPGIREIAHSFTTIHNMTVTETLKDAVGLGHGGPSTRTSSILRQHLRAHMRHWEQEDHVAAIIDQEC
jgi:hypothetical protein